MERSEPGGIGCGSRAVSSGLRGGSAASWACGMLGLAGPINGGGCAAAARPSSRSAVAVVIWNARIVSGELRILKWTPRMRVSSTLTHQAGQAPQAVAEGLRLPRLVQLPVHDYRPAERQLARQLSEGHLNFAPRHVVDQRAGENS